jgi:hypothetical protein
MRRWRVRARRQKVLLSVHIFDTLIVVVAAADIKFFLPRAAQGRSEKLAALLRLYHSDCQCCENRKTCSKHWSGNVCADINPVFSRLLQFIIGNWI